MNKNYLLTWVEKQQSQGKYVFSLEKVLKEFTDQSEDAIELALNRLSKKNRVISIYKGFYLIIPPEYAAKGILPPLMFIDDLMSFIGKSYYIGLLSAAALHGAAHQQPQEFFVVTTSKQFTTKKKDVKINYFTRKTIPEKLLEKRETEFGYVKVSSAELTAADLVYYHNRIGGLDRVCNIIMELAETIDIKKSTGISLNIFLRQPSSVLELFLKST
jgi:predicted transcriptional regulator of viral defense system